MTNKKDASSSSSDSWFKTIGNGFKYMGAAISSPKLVGSVLASTARSALALTTTVLSFAPMILGRGPLIIPALGMTAAFGYFVARPALLMAAEGWLKTEEINSQVYRRATGKPARVKRVVQPKRSMDVPEKGASQGGFNAASDKPSGDKKKMSKEERMNLMKKLRMDV